MSGTRPGRVNLLTSLTLGVWALALIWLLDDGRYQLLIRADLWPILAGGLVFLLLFILGGAVGSSGRDCQEGSAVQRWVRAGIMLLPLGYLAVGLPGGGLDSHAFGKRFVLANDGAKEGPPGSSQAVTDEPASASSREDSSSVWQGQDGSSTPWDLGGSHEPAEESRHLNLDEIQDNLGTLQGQRIITEGRVFRGGMAPEGYVIVFRFLILCCAADAVPVGVLVAEGDAAGFEDNAWVQIEGVVGKQRAGDAAWPVIERVKIEPIEAPSNPYLR